MLLITVADGRMLATWEEKRHTLALRETATGKLLGEVHAPAGPPVPPGR